MKTLKVLSIISMFLLLDCAVSNAVLSEYDKTVDFNYYETFVLCVDDLYIENSKYPNIDNNTVRELIGDEVTFQMEALGYKPNVMKAQLQAGFKIVITEKTVQVTNCEIQEDIGYWKSCTIDDVVYTRETLVVFVSDIDQNQVLWQASIPCELNKSKDKLKVYVENLISQLYEAYPEVNK
jgi:hypothetical protein